MSHYYDTLRVKHQRRVYGQVCGVDLFNVGSSWPAIVCGTTAPSLHLRGKTSAGRLNMVKKICEKVGPAVDFVVKAWNFVLAVLGFVSLFDSLVS